MSAECAGEGGHFQGRPTLQSPQTRPENYRDISNDMTKSDNQHRSKKVLVTAYDLEQVEHRGIAVFSKNLIRALHELGYEVWLLTSVSHDPKNLTDTILRHLSVPRAVARRISFVRKLPGFYTIKKLLPKKIKQLLRSMIVGGKSNPFRIDFENIASANLPEQRWNGRLTYLGYIRGFINVPNIFIGSIAAIEGKGLAAAPQLHLDQYGFHGVITTSPLPITFRFSGWQVQTVHDLIPIEIPSDHPWDDPSDFYQRVQAACRFSNMTLTDALVTAERMDALGFKPRRIEVLHLPRSFTDSQEAGHASKNMCIQPYVVSIGSIEPRKNILMAVQSFLASDLPGLGYRYVVIGDVKSGADARKLKALSGRTEMIVLTGYVDDQMRDELLLNSECLVFPSIMEGYGIPLVDAIQLSKKIICSDIPVFRELAEDNAVFVSPREGGGWMRAFNSLQKIRPAVPNPKYEFEEFRSNVSTLLENL